MVGIAGVMGEMGIRFGDGNTEFGGPISVARGRRCWEVKGRLVMKRRRVGISRAHHAWLFVVRCGSVFFVVVGGGVVWMGFAQSIEAIESASWPSVPGVVVESKILKRGSGRGGITQRAKVVYEYEAEGADHRGDRVAVLDFGSTWGGPARRIVARYPVGQSVIVRHRPGAAQQSLLEPGWKMQVLFPVALGLGFAGVGGLFFVVVGREKRRLRARGVGVQRALLHTAAGAAAVCHPGSCVAPGEMDGGHRVRRADPGGTA